MAEWNEVRTWNPKVSGSIPRADNLRYRGEHLWHEGGPNTKQEACTVWIISPTRTVCPPHQCQQRGASEVIKSVRSHLESPRYMRGDGCLGWIDQHYLSPLEWLAWGVFTRESHPPQCTSIKAKYKIVIANSFFS